MHDMYFVLQELTKSNPVHNDEANLFGRTSMPLVVANGPSKFCYKKEKGLIKEKGRRLPKPIHRPANQLWSCQV